MNIAKALRQFLRTSNGSVTVEFIATLPLLLVTLVFSFEFGYALWTYDVATRDVRAAARYLARTNPLDTVTATTMAKSGLPASTTVRTYCSGASCTDPPVQTFLASSLRYRQDGEVVQVRASVPLTLTFLTYLNTASSFASTGSGKSAPTTVGTVYTLVVSAQARHNTVGD